MLPLSLFVSRLQLQDAEAERRRRIARLQAVVMTLENLLIRPAEPPSAEGAFSTSRSSDAVSGREAATRSKRRRRLDSETVTLT